MPEVNEDDNDDDDIYQIMNVRNFIGRNEPILVKLDLNKKTMSRELDTGAAATLIL